MNLCKSKMKMQNSSRTALFAFRMFLYEICLPFGNCSADEVVAYSKVKISKTVIEVDSVLEAVFRFLCF